jgi:hypothetical protein
VESGTHYVEMDIEDSGAGSPDPEFRLGVIPAALVRTGSGDELDQVYSTPASATASAAATSASDLDVYGRLTGVCYDTGDSKACVADSIFARSYPVWPDCWQSYSPGQVTVSFTVDGPRGVCVGLSDHAWGSSPDLIEIVVADGKFGLEGVGVASQAPAVIILYRGIEIARTYRLSQSVDGQHGPRDYWIQLENGVVAVGTGTRPPCSGTGGVPRDADAELAADEEHRARASTLIRAFVGIDQTEFHHRVSFAALDSKQERVQVEQVQVTAGGGSTSHRSTGRPVGMSCLFACIALAKQRLHLLCALTSALQSHALLLLPLCVLHRFSQRVKFALVVRSSGASSFAPPVPIRARGLAPTRSDRASG